MVGAVGVFAMMTLAYAVIPHEWITFADKYLQWDTTKFVVQSGQKIIFFNFPFNITMKAIRDIIVVGIYIVFFGLNLALFAMWQKRGQEKPEGEAAEAAHLAVRSPAAAPGQRAGHGRRVGERW